MLGSMHPDRTFKLLIGTSAMLALLLAAAVSRVTMAGCPEGWSESPLACLFLPTHTDLYVHLLGYTFTGAVVSGIFSGLILWRRQWTKGHMLSMESALSPSLTEGLMILIHRLGLQDKVRVLDSDANLCFCAGLISPRIYVFRGAIEKLTTLELEAVLLHEKHHLKNRLPFKKLVVRLIVSILFFIPILQDMLRQFLIEAEIVADSYAIQHQGHRRGIAGALQKMLQEFPKLAWSSITAGGADALTYRIDCLTGRTPRLRYRVPLKRFVTSVIITAFIAASTLLPLPSSHPVNSALNGVISSHPVQEVSS